MTRIEIERERQKERNRKKNIMRKEFLKQYFKFLGFLAFIFATGLLIMWCACGAQEQQFKEAEMWKNNTYVYPQG